MKISQQTSTNHEQTLTVVMMSRSCWCALSRARDLARDGTCVEAGTSPLEIRVLCHIAASLPWFLAWFLEVVLKVLFVHVVETAFSPYFPEL
jgi:hypothetical protein